MANFWRHRTRTPKRTATRPATKTGSDRRSIRHTQNIAESLLGSSMFIAIAVAISGTPTM